MSEEEVVDAESSTLNKQTSPMDHLRHLLKVGWEPDSPLIKSYTEKHHLQDELTQILNGEI